MKKYTFEELMGMSKKELDKLEAEVLKENTKARERRMHRITRILYLQQQTKELTGEE